jgi:hypothetical protein
MMKTFVPAVLATLAFGLGPAAAQGMEDPVKRRLFLPTVRATTDCIARETLREPELLAAVRDLRVSTILEAPIRRCSPQVIYMINEHNRIYGDGGREFFSGPYVSDLPRAVQQRIGSEVQRRQAEQDRVEQVQREQTARVEAERRAEAERRSAERKLEMERIENDRRAEAIRQAELRSHQAAEAAKTRDVLRKRAFDCTLREVLSTVTSGESAETLANVAITICSTEVAQFIDAALEVEKISSGGLGSSAENVTRTHARTIIRDYVLAGAVKAKAAINSRSPSGSASPGSL